MKFILGFNVLISGVFVSVIAHEVAHYLMMKETFFIGLTFNNNFAETCGIVRVENQEPIAQIAGIVVLLIWLTGSFIALKEV